MRDYPWNPADSWTGTWNQWNRPVTDRVDRWELTPRELKALLEAGDDIAVVDVREPWEAEICRIEGSRLIPLTELDYRADDELDRDQDIVLYCHHGIRSMEAAMTLWSMGFERVRNLAGGIARWADDVDSEMERY
jgi:adenylyltransferase/sulfurtransferase